MTAQDPTQPDPPGEQPHGSGAGQNDAPMVELRLTSDVRLLAGVRELVSHVAQRLGVSHDSSSHLALAVDEALCNVIRHGYKQQPGRPIWVRLWPLEDDGRDGPGLRVVIEDEAPQVDVRCIQGRDLDDVRPGGLGVHIIRQVVDLAEYAPRPTVGMRLTLVKRSDGPSARRTRALTHRCCQETGCGCGHQADAPAGQQEARRDG